MKNYINTLLQAIKSYNEGHPKNLVNFLDKAKEVVDKSNDKYPGKIIYYTLKNRIATGSYILLSYKQALSLILAIYDSAPVPKVVSNP